MSKKAAGRKHKLTEEEVNKVIKLFKEEEKPSGMIAYADIFRFANKLFEENIISASTSDSFWRKEGRLGKTLVDKANQIFTEAVVNSKGNEVILLNMMDLINKKYNNKDEFTKHLLFMETQFHQTLQREKKLNEDLLKLEEDIQNEKEKKKHLEKSNNELQKLVYSLFRTLSDVTDPVVKEKTEMAMKTVFDSPTTFFEFEERNKLVIENVSSIPVQTKEQPPKTKLSNRFRKS